MTVATLHANTCESITRELVLVGEDGDPNRRGNKVVVAVSECQFRCAADDILDRCVEAIRRSDEHLRRRPQEMMLWDWKNTYIERSTSSRRSGGMVILGVAWYDADFFTAKHQAYLNSQHLGLYAGIGLNSEDIVVSHRLIREG